MSLPQVAVSPKGIELAELNKSFQLHHLGNPHHKIKKKMLPFISQILVNFSFWHVKITYLAVKHELLKVLVVLTQIFQQHYIFHVKKHRKGPFNHYSTITNT